MKRNGPPRPLRSRTVGHFVPGERACRIARGRYWPHDRGMKTIAIVGAATLVGCAGSGQDYQLFVEDRLFEDAGQSTDAAPSSDAPSKPPALTANVIDAWPEADGFVGLELVDAAIDSPDAATDAEPDAPGWRGCILLPASACPVDDSGLKTAAFYCAHAGPSIGYDPCVDRSVDAGSYLFCCTGILAQ